MKKICCIISAGDVNTQLLAKKKSKYNYFIAADAGYEKALEAGITPSLVAGDFDSLSQHYQMLNTSTAPENSTADIPAFVQFPVEKDFSDTHLAIEEGIKLGYTQFEVYGALGGDHFSHSIANLQTLCTMKQNDISVTLIGMKEIIYLLRNEAITLTPPIHSTFSVFSLSDKSDNVTILGAKYPLIDATLTNTFPLGVSNQSISEALRISVKEGLLLVVLEF